MQDRAPRPMPTRLHGRVFRSRLEAKWSLFLDAMDLRWDYEPEWFLLKGEGYCPDFALLDYPNTWLEVKALGPEIDERRFRAFAAAGARLLLVIGSPWVDEHEVVLFEGDRREGGMAWAVGRTDGSVWLARLTDGFAVPLGATMDSGEMWPRTRAHTLLEAFRYASGYEFWTPKQ